MYYILNAQEMKACDEATIRRFKVPGMVLMERAALGIARQVQERFSPQSRILIVAGNGNNGGDALAAGRILMQRGYRTEYLVLGDRERGSDSLKMQIEILEAYGAALFTKLEAVFDNSGYKKYDIIIDGLLGIGVSRPLKDEYADAVEQINQAGAYVIAVDIPSGINADTGGVYNVAVRADLTVTFGFRKRGHFFYPGTKYTKELCCEEIGITMESFLSNSPEMFVYEESDLNKIPTRRRDGHKGNFGKVLLIAGSPGMCGACELSAKSAYRIGAGMVKLVTNEANREILQRDLPEAMLLTYRDEKEPEDFLERLTEAFDWADCIAIGPGLGTDKQAKLLVEQVLTKCLLPAVWDADALNLLAREEELMKLFTRQSAQREFVLTPHPAEFIRISGMGMEQYCRERTQAVRKFAADYNVVLVGKDARTLVAGPEGPCYMNISGNSGMATAGSGDVLTGIIAGLIGQGMTTVEAARIGVFIHGLAGDRAASKTNEYALMASDIIEELKYIRKPDIRQK